MLNPLIGDYSPESRNLSLTSKILKGTFTLLLCLVLVFGVTIAPTQAATYTRYEAHSPEGQKNLKSLQIALAKMRALGCQDPRSWYYQGAIHWVPTTNGDITGLKEDNPLCPYYPGFTDQDKMDIQEKEALVANAVNELLEAAPRDEASRVGNFLQESKELTNLITSKAAGKLLASWDNCTHADNQAEQSSVVHFLPWHRLFIYHFEKIVRDLSGNPDFSLPYWGYIGLFDNELPDQKLLTMPVELREPSNTSENSLYETARLSSLQAGQPIEEGFANQYLLDAVEGLRRQNVYIDFDSEIDQAPHGLMHVYIGGATNNETFFNPIYNRDDENGLMTNVPSAGFDPVFWLHHSNIDRLWAQWTKETGVLVTEQELAKVSWPYQFFEPDGTIKGYTMPEVSEIIYNLDYNFDDVAILSPETYLAPSRISSNITAQTTKTLLGVQQVQETVGTDRILTETVPLRTNLVRPLESLRSINREAVPATQPNYTLEVKVAYTGRPTGIYEVYLNLPNEEAMSDIDTYFAGVMSFFVLDSNRSRTKTFQFDITDELLQQTQTRRGVNPDAFSISIRKQGGSEDETLKVESVALYLQE